MKHTENTTDGHKRTRRARRIAVVSVAALAVAAGGGVAYAYWTAGGSGTGSATTGTTEALVAHQTSTVSAMFPGDSAQTLSGNFDNGNSGPIFVTSVVASIASVTDAGGDAITGCGTSDYSLTNATMAVGHPVAKGNGVDGWTGA